MIHHIPSLYITASQDAGRGVFTTEEIQAGSMIEACPVIVLEKKDLQVIHQTKLHDYYFLWGEKQEQAAIALGYGSLYNHSKEPNAAFELDYETQFIMISALRKIEAGAEIRIDYHAGLQVRDLWF